MRQNHLRDGSQVVHWLSVWGPAVFMSLVIFTESTDTFSAAHTSSMLRPWVERVFGAMSNNAWGLLHNHIRKTGHFIGYGMVCLAFLRGWLHTPEKPERVSRTRWWFRSCGLGVLSAAAIAGLDEWHQSFIPSRTASPIDVLLDTCGAVSACILLLVIRRLLRGPTELAAASGR